MAYIYIMTNPAYEGYVKIGSTDQSTVEQRREQLSKPEGVMFPFEVYAYYETDENLKDKSVQKLIDTINPDLRANKRREFYKMSPERAFTILEAMATIHNATDKLTLVAETNKTDAKTRKPPFSFASAKIPFGSEINYTEDPEIVAIVKDDRHIEYQGKTRSLSDLAQELLDSKWQVQGTLYFTYKGETLHDRRIRMEGNEEYK